MENIDITLWIIFGFGTLLFWYIGKVYISQPDYNVPPIFRNPIIGKFLVLVPQIAYLAVAILGFILTDNGWRFLIAVIVAVIFLSPKPQRGM